MNIFESIAQAQKKELPFVIYNPPNSETLHCFVQHNINYYTVSDYTEKGFVFAPFDLNNDAILIPEHKADYFTERCSFDFKFNDSTHVDPDFSSKKKHIQLVEKGVEAIQKESFQKVVLSRKELIELTQPIALAETFQKMAINYPTAFVYWWYHPKVGTWMGATPETLVHIKGKSFSTMSLAGTQVFNEDEKPKWSEKEIEEQHIVTEFISNKLQPICTELNVHKLETVRIGNLLHLRTLIQGTVQSSLKAVIQNLHPTPAVCGFPKEMAKNFILKEEGYDRKFYTGFLGRLNRNQTNELTSELFVNLRCMEITTESEVSVYIGGGITKESVPEKEWLETVAKSKAMKNML